MLGSAQEALNPVSVATWVVLPRSSG